MGHSAESKLGSSDIYSMSRNSDCYVSMAEVFRPKKKAKRQYIPTITLDYLHSKGKSMKVKHMKRIRILFDTGCGATLINHSMVTKLRQKQEKPCNWNTKAGSFQTSKTCKIKFTLPAFHKHRNISWKAFVDETDTLSSRYDMIIGRNLLEELGIISCSKNTSWSGTMPPHPC